MKPIWRRNAALGLVVVTLIGWPLSAFFFAAVDIAATTDVRTEQDEDA